MLLLHLPSSTDSLPCGTAGSCLGALASPPCSALLPLQKTAPEEKAASLQLSVPSDLSLDMSAQAGQPWGQVVPLGSVTARPRHKSFFQAGYYL